MPDREHIMSKAQQMNLFKKKSVYCENHMNRTNAPCLQNAEL
jgi:hypothetical protein